MSNNSFSAQELQMINGSEELRADSMFLHIKVNEAITPQDGVATIPMDLVLQKQVKDNPWNDQEVRSVKKRLPLKLVVITDDVIAPSDFSVYLDGLNAKTAFRTLGTGRTRKTGDNEPANSTAVFNGSVTFTYEADLVRTCKTHRIDRLVMRTQESADPNVKRRVERPINEYVIDDTLIYSRKSKAFLQLEARTDAEPAQAAD